MSTKTSIKRIALVAVSALGFGLLSVVPSQAALIYSSPNVSASVGNAATDSVSIVVNTRPTAGEVAGALFFTSSTETGADFTVAGMTLVPILDTAAGAVVEGADAGLPGGYTAGTLAWNLDADAGTASVSSQIRLEIENTNGVAAGSTLKICSAIAVVGGDEACTAASTIATITVAAVAGTTTRSMFAVDIPSATTSYASANSAVVTQSASTGGYVELAAVAANVAAVAPNINLVSVTNGTILAEGAGNAPGDFLFNGAGGIANGATQAILGTAGVGTSLLIATPSTGSVTVRFITRTFAGGVSTDTTRQTFTINVNTSLATYQYSTVTMTADNNGFVGGDDILYAPAAASIAVGNINVAQFNAANTALSNTNAKAVVVTLSGTAGSLSSATGGASVTTATAVLDADTDFDIFGNGTSGTSTISVAVNGVTAKTLTVKFYGAAAKVEASANYEVARAGNGINGYAPGLDDANNAAYAGSVGALFTTATTTVGEDQDTAIAVLVTDAKGTPVPVTISVTSSNPVAVTPALLSFVDSGDGDGSAGVFYNHYQYETTALAKSGDKATLTFTVTLSDGTSISDSVDLTVGGTKTGGTVTMALDKTTYQPGERMILTFTGKDAAGNPVYDGATVGTLSSNKAVTNLASAQGAFVNGSRIYGDGATELLYAPAASGPFTITLATGTATGATISVTGTVGDDAATAAATAASDAAAEAIDAANAATDAANLAAEAADAATVAAEEARDAADAATAAVEELATQVATLMAALKAQITTLANTVAKIAKKVKA